MVTDYRDTHFNLYQFFGGYLNQSWRHIYNWEGREPAYAPVVRKYKAESENVDRTISELKKITLLGKGFNEEDWMDILTWGLSLGYYPPGDDLSYEKWLEDVLKILEEPIEETKKHFVPKRVGE